MNTFIRHALAILFLVTCVLGCSKANMPDSHNDDSGEKHQGRVLSEGIVLKEGVFYFSGDDQQYIAVLDTNKIAVKANIPPQMKFGVGDVVLVDFSQKAPMGFAGKVISQKEESGETIFYTQAVSLVEIYEELSIDSDIDAYKNADSVVDGEGQVYQLEPVEEDDFEQITEEEEEDEPVKGLTDKDFTSFKSIPIKSDNFSGKLFVSSHAHVNIEIKKGKINEYDILLERQSYLSSQLSVGTSGKLSIPVIPQEDFRLPAGIPLCPGIVLQPILSVSVDFESEGAMRLQSNLYVKFENTSVRFHNGQYTNNSKTKPEIKLTPTYLDCEASAELKPRVALKFDVWGLKLLGFGVDMQSSFKFSLNGSMDMSNKAQLKKDVKAKVELGGSMGIFLYAKFIAGDNDLRGAISFPSESYEIDLLDKGKNHSIKREFGEWSVTGEFGDDVLLSVDKRGYALFKIGEEEPLAMKFLETVNTKSGSEDVVFNIPDNSFDYYVRPYNIIKNATGEYYFYGGIIGSFISKITHNNVESYSFTYDDYGRLIHVRNGDIKISYSYLDTGIKLDFNGENENIGLDSYGRMISYNGYDHTRSFSYPSDDRVDVHEEFVIAGSKTIYNRTLNYNSGSLQTQSISSTYGSDFLRYDYTDYLNNYSIDFVRYFVGDLLESVLPPFLVLPVLRSQYLLSRVNFVEADVTIPVSYTFNENGQVSQFSWQYHGQNNATITYNTEL